MSFLESPRLDPMVTQGAKSTVRWNREKVYAGRERKLEQDFRSAHAKHEMDVSHGVRENDQHQAQLLDLFYVVFHNGHTGFRAKDWRDCRLTSLNSALSFVIGSTWQINRRHSYGAAEYLRPVKKPVVSIGIVVYRTRAGVVTVATAATDYTTGIVTITGHVAGDTYTCVGEFDLPMTFVDNDWVSQIEGTVDDIQIVTPSILLEEIRL